MPKLSLTFHHYSLIAIILWATSYIFTKLAMASYTAGSMGLVRNVVASLILLAATFRQPVPSRRDWGWFILSGLSGLGLYMYLFNHGTRMTGPTTSCIVIATAPVFTAILASVIFRETIRPAGWAAIGLAFAGILVMTLWKGTLAVNAGMIWLLAASGLLSVYFLLQRRLAVRYTILQITTWSFVAGALALLPCLPETLEVLRTAPAGHTAMVVYMGVFPSAIGYLAWVKALSIAPKTSYVTNYMFLTPLLALLLELAVLGALPDAGTLLGGAMILAALALFSMFGK